MSDDTIASFLVALGWKNDDAGQKKVERSVSDYERAVRAAEQRVEAARRAGAATAQQSAEQMAQADLRAAREALRAAREQERAAQQAADAREKEAKKHAEAIAFAITKLNLFVSAAAEAGRQIAASVTGTIEGLNNLYYVAGRTGASVQSIRGLGYAFSQVGGTVGQAVSALEGFAKATRTNEGIAGLVKDFGIDTTKDKAEQLLDLVDKFKQMPYQEGAQYAGLAGIDENSFKLLSDYSGQVRKFYAERARALKDFNLDEKQASEASARLMQGLGSLSMTVDVAFTKLLTTAAPRLSQWIGNLNEWIRTHQKEIGEYLEWIAQKIEWVGKKFDAFFKYLNGTLEDGDTKKQFDSVRDGVLSFASAIETLYKRGKQLVESDFWKIITAPSPVGALSSWLLGINSGGAAGGAPGVGAVGGFNPLEQGGGRNPGGGAANAPADGRRWYEKVLPKALGGKDAPGREVGAWWTPERQQHAIDTLKKGGLTELGAKGLVARWASVEAPGGPGAVNPKSGAFGIGQWLGGREKGILGNTDFDAQLGHALKELDGPERKARDALNAATTPMEAARGASMFERAEGYDRATGVDNFTAATAEAMGKLGQAAAVGARQVAGSVAALNGVGGVDQAQGGARHRTQPITEALRNQLVAAGVAAGVNAEIFSGGQDEGGRHRTGSHRHDHGNAADLRLYRFGQNGEKRYLDMRNDADRTVMEKFVRASVKAGATGVGAAVDYMGPEKLHIGGGSPAAWGANGATANAPDWVSRAHREGMRDRTASAAQPAPRIELPEYLKGPGGFDVNALTRPVAPLGASTTNNNGNTNTVHQKNEYNVKIDGSGAPEQHSRLFQRAGTQMSQLHLENAQRAFG